MSNRYEIRTVSDIINKIPTDRLDAFFSELRAGVESAQVVMAETARLFPEGKVQVSDRAFEWTDDGEKKVAIVLNAKPQRQRADRAERILAEIRDTLYGKNLAVANWHQNGELEPLDSFFESNDWIAEKPERPR